MPLEDELLELDELELLELEDELELDELELEELEVLELDVLELEELPLLSGSLSAPQASSRVDNVLTIPKRAIWLIALNFKCIMVPIESVVVVTSSVVCGSGVNGQGSHITYAVPFILVDMVAESGS